MQKKHHFQNTPIYLTLNGPGRYWWNPVGLPKKAAIQEKEKAMHYTIRPLLWSYTLPARNIHECCRAAIDRRSAAQVALFSSVPTEVGLFIPILGAKYRIIIVPAKKYCFNQSSLKPFLGKKWTRQMKNIELKKNHYNVADWLLPQRYVTFLLIVDLCLS